MTLKRFAPWWAKIGAKVVLSRLDVDYSRWRRWGLFVHGQMDRPAYAVDVVLAHLARVGWTDCAGRVVVELGPGDSLATAVIARALGARHVYLVDAGDFARYEAEPYQALTRHMATRGLTPPDLRGCDSRSALLAACDATYLTTGLHGLDTIPAASADLVFSQAVLEHVRLSEFDATQRAIRRILRPTGVASHQVDLKDHLGGALNSLRFTHETWEAEWMASSGFYTNRLRMSEILASMRAAGLEPDVTAIERWRTLPTPPARLAPHFRAMPEEELAVKQFDCVARPAAVVR